MQRTSTIRFLTPTTNKKGDLFTRLMTDLFRALGYDDFRLDVNKSGREIDIEGQHRHAARLLRVECKAHEDKMGGTELNTFMGAVTRERRKALKTTGMQVDAYFVSLGGFTEPSKDQEEEFGDEGLILLDGPKVVAELEKHRLLITDIVAAEHAGQCAGRAGLGPGLLESTELLAHEMGYVKAVYYAQNKQRSHVALIHADGTPLATTAAQAVIEADRTIGGGLYELIYLPPAPAVADLKVAQATAMEHYRRWLSTECSYMQLDGIPADNDISATKLRLERLFIPLKAEMLNYEGPDEVNPNPPYTFDDFEYDEDDEDAKEAIADHIFYSRTPEPISQLLAPGKKLAFLAPPGGGKSTLLKRIATEYGFADQATKFADEMPPHDWLPLLIRCRDLQQRAKKPFMKLLERLPKQLNMLPEPAAAFKAYIHEALQLGRVLLLIDGLDEIAKEQNRKVFAKNLLSFLALFPQVTLVLTSREAGFRIVADVVASQCAQYKLAPFTEEDVQRLCVQWHIAVINDSSGVEQKARKLAQDIWENKHIRQLAKNPLLLTTLFVVNRRQGGQLPKNRLMLYSKAVEVLIQTWNSEAFEPLDVEETLTMLCYLACYMMEKEMQQISRRELIQTLQQAQQAVPELRYMQTSPATFIKQVEYRSSLLMQVGSDLIDNEEQQIFEFRHLTFQEYLAAKGYVEGYHPQNGDGTPLVELLTPHFGQSSWREVIPLAAALAKRQAEALIVRLLEQCADLKEAGNKPHTEPRATVEILRRCILDEVLISSPAVLDEALRQLGRLTPTALAPAFTRDVLDSKFGKTYRHVIEQAYMADTNEWREYLLAFSELSSARLQKKSEGDDTRSIDIVIDWLREENKLTQLQALAALIQFTFKEYTGFHRILYGSSPFKTTVTQASELYTLLDHQLLSGDERALLTASNAFAWLPNILPIEVLPPASSIASLFRIMRDLLNRRFEREYREDLYRHVSIALRHHPLLGRTALANENTGFYYAGEGAIGELIIDQTMHFPGSNVLELGLVAAWYHLVEMADQDLLKFIDDTYDVSPRHHLGDNEEPFRVVNMLAAFGNEGEKLLAKRAEQRRLVKENSPYKDL